MESKTSNAIQSNSQPNRFTLADCQGSTEVVFFPQALDPLGVPDLPKTSQFTYQGPEGRFVFQGNEIIQQEAPLGFLITVTLQPDADAGQLDLVLVLPPVILQEQKQQQFEALAITPFPPKDQGMSEKM